MEIVLLNEKIKNLFKKGQDKAIKQETEGEKETENLKKTSKQKGHISILQSVDQFFENE